MTARRSVERPWSVPVAVTEVPETGRRVELVPDAATRGALAGAVGVAALHRLAAEFDLVRHGHDGLRVSGRVTATVDQLCVVTLETVQSEISENVDLVFEPASAPDPKATRVEAVASLDAEEPPEAMQNGTVDLGAVATEFLLLGIDPYPRKPGVTFDAPPAGDPAAHPFAALAALKKGNGEKDR
jgi:hypothetical protein